MADFMRMKYEKPKLKQSKTANQLGYSTSTLQRYRPDIDMLSPYQNQPTKTKKQQKRPQILNLTTIHIVTPMLKDLV